MTYSVLMESPFHACKKTLRREVLKTPIEMLAEVCYQVIKRGIYSQQTHDSVVYQVSRTRIQRTSQSMSIIQCVVSIRE